MNIEDMRAIIFGYLARNPEFLLQWATNRLNEMSDTEVVEEYNKLNENK